MEQVSYESYANDLGKKLSCGWQDGEYLPKSTTPSFHDINSSPPTNLHSPRTDTAQILV